MEIKKRKLITIGNSKGFVVPKKYRKELARDKFYDLNISESKIEEVDNNGSDK